MAVSATRRLPIPSAQHSIYFDLTDNKLITHDAKAAKNGPVTSEGNLFIRGRRRHLLHRCIFARQLGPVKLVTFSDTVPTAANPKEEPHVGVGIGDSHNNFAVFVGPKDLDILECREPAAGHALWTSAGSHSSPSRCFWRLHYVNDHWVHNYGWAIVIVTIIINFLLFPLKLSNLKSMKKMQALQPQIAAINEKYKGISMRDPRKQQQNEEMMALYKKHGANPMGGCLPMAVQIPFFIAFYKVLSISIEMRHATLAVGAGSCQRPSICRSTSCRSP